MNIYVDGGFSPDKKIGGIGIVLKDKNKVIKRLTVRIKAKDPQHAEKLAILYSILKLKQWGINKATIITDNSNLVSIINRRKHEIKQKHKSFYTSMKNICRGCQLNFRKNYRGEFNPAHLLATGAVVTYKEII